MIALRNVALAVLRPAVVVVGVIIIIILTLLVVIMVIVRVINGMLARPAAIICFDAMFTVNTVVQLCLLVKVLLRFTSAPTVAHARLVALASQASKLRTRDA